MATVKLENICKIYDGGVKAVDNVNIDIEDREFVVLVGPSGCGKSTTLRMVAGLEDISSGTLTIDGKVVNDVPPKDRDIAMVFQNYALYPHMTVYDNMAFGLKIRKFDKEEIDRRVREAAKILDIEQLLERKPKALSGGQRQRVAVGRAIIRKVGIFLMDEPLSNLDAKQRVTMRSEITEIHRKTGATTIYVTHDQTEAMTMADRIVVMKEGYIQQVGTPYELYFNPVNVFVAGFIGEPPMNFVRSTLKNGKIMVGKNEIDLTKKMKAADIKKYEGKELVFGFRPEAISLGAGDGYVIKAEVELTELLGDNTNVYVDIQGDKSILKVNPHDTPEMDSEIIFTIPLESVYIFDNETEKVIK